MVEVQLAVRTWVVRWRSAAVAASWVGFLGEEVAHGGSAAFQFRDLIGREVGNLLVGRLGSEGDGAPGHVEVKDGGSLGDGSHDMALRSWATMTSVSLTRRRRRETDERRASMRSGMRAERMDMAWKAGART